MSKAPSLLLEELWLHHCPFLTHEINCFSIHEFMKQFWCHQICKFYQNITSSLVFMMVFWTDGNVFIVLPIRLKTCNFSSLQREVCTPFTEKFLRCFAGLSAYDRHRACNLLRPGLDIQEELRIISNYFWLRKNIQQNFAFYKRLCNELLLRHIYMFS